MSTPIDPDLLSSFVDEVTGYLGSLVAVATRPDSETWQEAHNACHTIKGAAAMLGLSALSEIAFLAEGVCDKALGGDGRGTPEAVAALTRAAEAMDQFVCELGAGEGGDTALLGEVSRELREVTGHSPTSVAAPEEESDTRAERLPVTAYGEATDGTDELLETFREEAQEQVAVLARGLRALDAGGDATLVPEMRRSAHTLKGSAALVGLDGVSRLAHKIEDALDRLADSVPEQATLRWLFETVDAIEDLVNGKVVVAEEGAADLAAAFAEARPDGSEADVTRTDLQTAEAEEGRLAAQPLTGVPAQRVDAAGREASTDVVRIRLARLVELERLASELVVQRAAFEQHHGGLVRHVAELELSLRRLTHLVDRLQVDYEARTLPAAVSARGSSGVEMFDPLEFDRYSEFHVLSRALAETAGDLRTLGTELAATAADFEGDSARQERLTRELQDKFMRLRMVPLDSLAGRLYRAVRVTADGRGKQARLMLAFGGVEIDKSAIEAVSEVLLHLLRNAVDHGIEAPALRRALGKDAVGRVDLTARYEGMFAVLEISDDGAGFDLPAIVAAAKRMGLPSDSVGAVDEGALLEVLFRPGFTTARELTEVSGRGVGLDVVRSRVAALRGSITTSSSATGGARFTIRLPTMLAVARALIVSAGRESLALPAANIIRVARFVDDQIERLGGQELIRLDGRPCPLVRLGGALGLSAPGEAAGQGAVVVFRFADRTAALLVEDIGEARDIVVRPLPALMGRVKGIGGATFMGDGSILLIVEPAEILGDRQAAVTAAPSQMRPLERPPRVLVVDDSVSVRRILANLGAAQGWDTATARDGVEALELLQSNARPPDVILLDIEMPRMDGYEVLSRLRGTPALRQVPVVVITSRSGEKHRQRAFELGATDFVVKPYQPDTLAGVVRRLARPGERSVAR